MRASVLLGVLLATTSAHAETKVSASFDGNKVVYSSSEKPDDKCWAPTANNTYTLKKQTEACVKQALPKIKIARAADGSRTIDGHAATKIVVITKKGPTDPDKVDDVAPYIVGYDDAKVGWTDDLAKAAAAPTAPTPTGGSGGKPADGAGQKPAAAKVTINGLGEHQVPDECLADSSVPNEKVLRDASAKCLADFKPVIVPVLEIDKEGTYWRDGVAVRELHWKVDLPDRSHLVAANKQLWHVSTITARRLLHEPCAFKDPDADVWLDVPNRDVVMAPPRSVIGTNRGLVVEICTELGQQVTVRWGGVRGVVKSAIAKEGGNLPAVQSGSDAESMIPVHVSTLRFSPRQPGIADIEVFEGLDVTKPALFRTELEVEQRYWGAFRVGLGTIFGGVDDDWKNYDTRTFAGSHTAEINESTDNVAFELVTGFAAYPEALSWLSDCGGRSHSGLECNWHISPYIGFGAVGTTDGDRLKAFTSFHAGLEIEFASNFSVALTFVRRKTRDLQTGYQDGSPVMTGATIDSVTTEGWVNGFGVVINASPEFLQFATGSSSTPKGGNP